MAALMTLSQLSGGNAVFESYYRQLDPRNTGKISAGDAAQFLKKSGLSDNTLGKIWDLADSDRKGYLDKRGFFIALRLVASAQGGNDISLNNLNQTAAAPKFRDTDSQLLSGSTTAFDSQWAIRPDEKGKFEGIFESLSPVNGLLSGEKVRPVLINSKLPLDVLGKIWDLSDVDKDGHLDKEEFTVALHLVYRAMEKEPVPSSLPPSLIPPSKRKKSANALPGAVAVLPALSGLTSGLAPLKDTLRSTPTLGGTASPLGRTASPVGSSSSSLGSITSHTPSPTNLSPQHSFKSTSAPAVNWVVSVVDKAKYDELFTNTDIDNNGCITGTDIIEIFMQSNLSQTMLAQIWGLADTKQTGKLNREQFALAMHLIQQKVNKGIDPPSALTSDMIPPSERTPTSAAGPSYLGLLPSLRPDVASAAKTRRDSTSSVGSVELTGIKELDDLSQEIAQLQREKLFLEQAIREKEETIRSKNSDVQDMQSNLDRESSGLHSLESQKQDAQGRLDEMDQQRSKLEGMLNEVKQKCQEESQLISSLQSQIRSRETNLRSQEDELSRTRADLSRLQEEESQLEQRLLSGRVQLDSVVKSLKSTQEEINQARSKLLLIQDSQKEMTRTIDQYNNALSEINKGNLNNLPDLSEGSSDRENGGVRNAGEAFKSKLAMFNNSSTKEPSADPFLRDDPFKYDLMKDPFGEDPFKENDPFKGTSPEDFFKTTDKSDLFGSADPFSRKPTPPVKPSAFSSGDPFKSSSPKPKDSDLFGRADPFGGRAGGFADFSKMSKKSDSPAVPSKKSIPNRPAPPYGSEHMKFGNESQQLEWVKRESEREEQERRRRLRLQEQQDLELAIALSKADISDA
ncbi:epidermal growth factor receptor substrate 15-like 1 isoform X3 [Nothobranchius furzeri]|uniref:Epidermal growth factor receptor pathway substrate 15 like 1 n=1 Tax=Nothobranchius furzeri TaxID=105023 RepID=A0A8C6KXK9_NOTFU|nr:epidermal growth factor receptor substrate 15-like 1 isoform X1 [Nothobranchius furzeri]